MTKRPTPADRSQPLRRRKNGETASTSDLDRRGHAAAVVTIARGLELAAQAEVGRAMRRLSEDGQGWLAVTTLLRAGQVVVASIIQWPSAERLADMGRSSRDWAMAMGRARRWPGRW